MAKEIPIPTAKQLRELRERLELTQAEAAEKIGVARRTWMYWERPKRTQAPSQSHAILISLLSDGKI